MTRWSQLHPLTRGLLWLIGGHVALSLVLVLLGYDTVLQHAAAFALGRAHDDSWEPMRQALAYVRSGAPEPLYEVVFFQRGTIFTYPTTSLLLLEAVGAVTGRALASDAALNVLSWCAVLATACASGFILIESSSTHLRDWTAVPRSERVSLWLLGAGATLLFYPVVKAFTLGQVQTVITALVTCGMLAWLRGRDRASGACFALACLVKPQIGLVVIWALLRRRWSFASAWLAVVAPIGLWSVQRYGLANQFDYLRQLSFISSHSWSYAPNQSVAGILNRALFIGHNLDWDTHYVPYDARVYIGTLISSALLVMTGLFAGLGRSGRDATFLSLACATIGFTMASPVAWEHHYGVLVPVFAWLAPWLAQAGVRAGRVAWATASFLAIATLMHPLDWFASTPVNILQNALFAGSVALLTLLLNAIHSSVQSAEHAAVPSPERMSR